MLVSAPFPDDCWPPASVVIGPDEYQNVKGGAVAVPGHESYPTVHFFMWEPGYFPGTITHWKSTSPVRKELSHYWWWFVAGTLSLPLRGLGVMAAEELPSLTCATTLTKPSG